MNESSERPSRFSTRVNSLGLGASGLHKILDAIENTSDSAAVKRRAFIRWPFPMESIHVSLLQPGKLETAVVAACRNLSAGGISLLHNETVQPGTKCSVLLPLPGAGRQSLAGTVVRCVQRTGTLHEIGIRFDEQIDVRSYVPASRQLKPAALERVDVRDLQGVLVHYCECGNSRAALRERLRATSLVVKSVADRGAFVRQLSLGCDVVLLEGPKELVKELAQLAHDSCSRVIGAIAATAIDARMLQLSIGQLAGVLVGPVTTEPATHFAAGLLHIKKVMQKQTSRALAASQRLESIRCFLDAAAASGDRCRCRELCSAIEMIAHEGGRQELAALASRTGGIVSRAERVSAGRLALLVRPLLGRIATECRTHAA